MYKVASVYDYGNGFDMGGLQREKEHKEIDFDSARKRLQQNYRQAENGFKTPPVFFQFQISI